MNQAAKDALAGGRRAPRSRGVTVGGAPVVLLRGATGQVLRHPPRSGEPRRPGASRSRRHVGFSLCYLQISRYSKQIERYFSMFDRAQVHFDEFACDWDVVLRELAHFLNMSGDLFFQTEQPAKANRPSDTACP